MSNTLMSTPNVLNAPLTQTGMIMGTPAYMAPEQFLAEATDHRTDQFSFCVALFEALYGHRPFGGETMSQLAKCVMRGQIDLPGKTAVPDHVLDALLKGLQCDAADRHDTMDVLIDAITTEPDTTATRTSWIWPVTSAAVLLTGILLYWISARMLEERPDYAPPRQSAPAAPGVLAGLPEPEGVITEEQIERVVKTHQEDVDECAEKGLARDPDLRATVGLQFEIRTHPDSAEKGTVEKVLLDHSRIFDKRTARCLLGMAMNWEVPAPACTAPALACTAKVAIDVRIEPPPPEKPGKGRKGAKTGG
jgi:serine/threonine protein kinase